MSIHLESKDLMNTQQMDVAVNGPDGATHLILCTGIANLGSCSHDIFTFMVGPSLSRRQFVGVIASGALSAVQVHGQMRSRADPETQPEARLVTINATYDEETEQVKVSAEIDSNKATTRLAISYNVSILAELPIL